MNHRDEKVIEIQKRYDQLLAKVPKLQYPNSRVALDRCSSELSALGELIAQMQTLIQEA